MRNSFELFIDVLAAIATFFVAAILCILIIGGDDTETNDNWYFSLIALIWTSLFYLIRRRFTWKVTFIQILFSTFVSIMFVIAGVEYLSAHLPGGMGYLIPVSLILLMILSKLASDRYIHLKLKKT